MKPKTLILMVVAVVCGLGASYMTSRLLAEREDRAPEVVEIPKVKVLVAKKNIDMHAALRAKPEEFFVEREFVKDDNIPKEALTREDLAKLKGKFVKRSLKKGDFVRADDILDSNFGINTLPPGMRAVGIPISAGNSASGFACVPGSHVDIQWTSRIEGENDTITKVLLEDVIVLAADTRANPAEEGGAIIASVVVVAVSPDDANVLTAALDGGTVRLLLRNFDDKASSDAKTARLKSIQKGQRGEPKKVETPQVAQDGPDLKRDDPGQREHTLPEAPEGSKKKAPALKKVTVTVKNGTDIRYHHYWVDEQDNIVANPQQYLEQFEQQQGAPAPDDRKGKKAPAGEI